MHSQIYSGLSLIFVILRNFRVAGANEFICARWANPRGRSSSGGRGVGGDREGVYPMTFF